LRARTPLVQNSRRLIPKIRNPIVTQRVQKNREKVLVSLTYREVAEILKVIDASNCDEVVLEIAGTRLVVRRSISGASGHEQNAMPSPIATVPAPAPHATSTTAPAAPIKGSAVAADTTSPGAHEVRAPMVGTFYRRPSPQEAIFVDVGQNVTKGQALCLIEVMKLFTTIEATVAGTIEAILPEDGALVEFDQLLFLIRPS
jgi:acetyl-CoA carboxylase biotin carboxyl carrier protein